MLCLRCGDCCIRFEIPELVKPAGVRCKHLTEDSLCAIWDKPERPTICYKHDYPARVCPIGLKNINK